MNTVKPYLYPTVSAQLHEKFEVSNAEIENSKFVRSKMCAIVNSLFEGNDLTPFCILLSSKSLFDENLCVIYVEFDFHLLKHLIVS